MNQKYIFTNDWISGFTQSDGSFVISFDSRKSGLPVRPQPIFNITQSINELDMFIALQKYLGVGRVLPFFFPLAPYTLKSKLKLISRRLKLST